MNFTSGSLGGGTDVHRADIDIVAATGYERKVANIVVRRTEPGVDRIAITPVRNWNYAVLVIRCRLRILAVRAYIFRTPTYDLVITIVSAGQPKFVSRLILCICRAVQHVRAVCKRLHQAIFRVAKLLREPDCLLSLALVS